MIVEILQDNWKTTGRMQFACFVVLKFSVQVSNKIFVILQQATAAVYVVAVGKLGNSTATHMSTRMNYGLTQRRSVTHWVKRLSPTIPHPQNITVRRNTNQNMDTSPSLYQQGIPCPFQNTTLSQMYWVKIFPATYLVTPLIRDGSQVLSVSLLNLFRRTRCQSPRDFWRVRRVVLMIFIALGAWWGQKECDHWVLHHRAPQRKEKVESPLLLLNSVLITWCHMTHHMTHHMTSHDTSHDISHDVTWSSTSASKILGFVEVLKPWFVLKNTALLWTMIIGLYQ